MDDKKVFKTPEVINTADGSPTLNKGLGTGEIQLEVVSTADGSPTLGTKGGEKMHSTQGALSESLTIYKPCVEKVLSIKKPRVLSLGLGLGYNELITLEIFLKSKKSQFTLISFEKLSTLRLWFHLWLKDENSPMNQYYDQILKKVSKHFDENPQTLKEFCSTNLTEGFFQILGDLPSKNPFDFGFHCILYDAFSNQSNPELWSENHLKTFVKSYCDSKQCHFATYASTGALKRVLKSEGFIFTKKKGFGRKRESTFASFYQHN